MNNRQYITGAWLAAVLAIMFALPTAAFAQDDICNNVPTLRSADTVERMITEQDYIWAFCFDGNGGDEVTIEVNVISGDLEAFLAVFEEESQDGEDPVAEIELLTGKSTPDSVTFDVPATGRYIIGIARVGLENGDTEGAFDLTMDISAGGSIAGGSDADSGAAVVDGECPADAMLIEAGTPAKGAISNSDYFASFCFYGDAGDTVTFSAEAQSGDLDTLLLLTDTNVSTNYGENDDCEATGNTDSCLEVELPASGNYLVAVGRFGLEGGSSEGNFLLTFDLEPGTGVAQADPDPGGEKEPPTFSGGVDDCDSDPLLTMIDGLWEFSLEDDGFRATFDFECDNEVVVEIEETTGNSTSTTTTTTSYTLELEGDDTYTLSIDLGDGESLRLENMVVVETGILALLEGESLIVLLNVQ